jgi:hypothetical protein
MVSSTTVKVSDCPDAERGVVHRIRRGVAVGDVGAVARNGHVRNGVGRYARSEYEIVLVQRAVEAGERQRVAVTEIDPGVGAAIDRCGIGQDLGKRRIDPGHPDHVALARPALEVGDGVRALTVINEGVVPAIAGQRVVTARAAQRIVVRIAGKNIGTAAADEIDRIGGEQVGKRRDIPAQRVRQELMRGRTQSGNSQVQLRQHKGAIRQILGQALTE